MSKRELIRFIRDLFWILLLASCCGVSVGGIIANNRLMTSIPMVVFMFFAGIYIVVGSDDKDE